MNEKTASERLEQLFGFKNEDGLSEAFLSVLEECTRDADEEVRRTGGLPFGAGSGGPGGGDAFAGAGG